jgi:hypothetical protein
VAYLNPSSRRYFVRAAVAMGTYLATIFAAAYGIRHGLVSGPAAWALAALPGLAIAGFIAAIGMRILELEDEYLRMLMVRQVLVGTGITLSLTTIWGFFEQFGLAGHIELYWVFVLWAVSLPIGALINRITHGTWGSCL